MPWRRALAILALVAAGCRGEPAPRIEIATTTSVLNSGLLAHLLPILERDIGVTVQVHAAGSGRALQMLAAGSVDAVISHAPEAEERMRAEHPEWSYRKIAHSWFAVAGPAVDPAQVKAATDVSDAFRRIADSGERFVSRGDESGTHERERAIWKTAGRQPGHPQLIVSGAGMAQALRHADEARAYLLTDIPTFRQLSDGLDLQILFEKDTRLVNSYAVIASQAGDAHAFASWLAGPNGRAAIASFTIAGLPAFTQWPAGCPGTQPDQAPCLNQAP